MGTIIGSGGQKIKTQRKVLVSLLCITSLTHIVLFVGIKCCYKGSTAPTVLNFVSQFLLRYLVIHYLAPTKEVFQ